MFSYGSIFEIYTKSLCFPLTRIYFSPQKDYITSSLSAVYEKNLQQLSYQIILLPHPLSVTYILHLTWPLLTNLLTRSQNLTGENYIQFLCNLRLSLKAFSIAWLLKLVSSWLHIYCPRLTS